MRNIFADPFWVDHHARFSADCAAGLATIAQLARGIALSKPSTPQKDRHMTGVLAGKTVVVIGDSNGIGAAVAELAFTEGATAFAVSRSGAGLIDIDGGGLL